MPVAQLELTFACSNRCVFCAQAGQDAAEQGAVEARLERLRPDADELVLAGGEPTLSDELGRAVRAARRLGFGRVTLQTNGHGLPERAADLARDGLGAVSVTVLGAQAPVHDYHTGAPGSFERLWRGVAAARAAGLEVLATTLVTRSNFRVLNSFPLLLHARGVTAWLLRLPHAAGRAADALDRVVPRLALALPFGLHALDQAQRLGLGCFLEGAPLCALGPWLSRALPGPRRAHGRACDDCTLRERCPGVDPSYLARFGEEELQTSRAAPPAPVQVPAFGEVGALAVRAGLAVPPSPEAARGKISALGKVQRAPGEVPGGAARQSTAELPELFPGLYGRS